VDTVDPLHEPGVTEQDDDSIDSIPVMDGFEATRRIRLWEAEHGLARTPIIAITANAAEVDRDYCLNIGMDGYVAKPLTIKAITRILQQHVADPALRASG